MELVGEVCKCKHKVSVNMYDNTIYIRFHCEYSREKVLGLVAHCWLSVKIDLEMICRVLPDKLKEEY